MADLDLQVANAALNVLLEPVNSEIPIERLSQAAKRTASVAFYEEKGIATSLEYGQHIANLGNEMFNALGN